MKIKGCALVLLLVIPLLFAVACGTGTTKRLSVSVDGQGSVTPNGGTFPVGNEVTLTATPKSGWLFEYWAGDVSGSQNPVRIIMDANKAVTAHFLEYDYHSSDLSINTKTLPAWIEGTYGSASLNATGGTGKLSWRGVPSEPWLVLSPSGLISGTAPLLPAGTAMRMTAPFTVTVTDEARHAREATYAIIILPKQPEIIPRDITAIWDESDPPPDNIIRPLATISSGYPPYRRGIACGFGEPMGVDVEVDTDGVTLILKGPPPKAKFEVDTHKFQICIVDSNNFEALADVTLVVKKAEGTTISGKVTNRETGALEGDAVITIDIINNVGKDVSISTTSSASAIDSKGNNYTIFLPPDMPDTTPTTVIVLNCTKSGFKPLASTVPNDKGSWLLDFPLEPIAGGVILIDSRLHHLGDNSYSGAVNSQFQTSAEGSTYSKSFMVESAQLDFTSATLSITHRGAECNNPIMINGTTITILSNSFFDGSLGTSSIPFDKSLLKEGTNTITITSFSCWTNDIDDFEFNNIYITFSK